MKQLYLTLSLALFLFSFTLAETTVGTYQEVEFGDYAHLIIVDESGETRSFWLGNDPALDELIYKPEEFAGRRIRVEWKRVKRDIPEAGGMMEIEEVTAVEKL